MKLRKLSIIFVALNFLLCTKAFGEEKYKNSVFSSLKNYTLDHKIQGVFRLDKGEENIITQAHGFSNFSRNQKFAIHDQMPILTATQQMTACAILLLEERKKLSVNDKISKFLSNKNWNGKSPPKWLDNITIHQLLNHSSGIPKYAGKLDISTNSSIGQIENSMNDFFLMSELDFTPGSKYEFSNSGYVLLDQIIEEVAQTPLEKFFKDEFFDKLSMDHSYFLRNVEALEIFNNDKLAKFPARYYLKASDGGLKFIEAGPQNIGLPYGDAGVVSNISDLVKWNKALHNGKVLSEASYRKLVKPYFKTNDRRIEYDSYMGYGTFISKLNSGHKYYHHQSIAFGISVDAGYVPEKKIALSILSNVMLLEVPGSEEIDFRKPENQIGISYLRNILLESL